MSDQATVEHISSARRYSVRQVGNDRTTRNSWDLEESWIYFWDM